MDVELHIRSNECIAQGYLTNSKRPESFVKGIYPTHVRESYGCKTTDTRGNEYIDFICGLGTSLLGFAHPLINAAVRRQLVHGTTHSLSTVYEIECAEKIKEFIPFIDAVKFLKTGTEACMAAVRIARSYTGRQYVLTEGYHGHSDEFLSLTNPASGIPNYYDYRKIDTIDDINQIDNTIAAVIVEPIISEITTKRIEWLKRLREKCTKHGVVLIFDEIITGFRFPKYSVATHLDITPDLICLGKALGGGFPLAVVGGKYDIMHQPDYFVSSTFAGETCSLVAAHAFMLALQNNYNIKTLWDFGENWVNEFNDCAKSLGLNLYLRAYPTRGTFEGDELTKALFFQEACLAGMLFGPSWFINFFHTTIDDSYKRTIREIMCQIQMGRVRLRGEMPRSPYSKMVRQW